MDSLNVVDLFCGAGGLSLGAARAGLAVRGAVDTDPKALETHSRNFPGTVHLNEDVAGLTGRSLKSLLGLARIDGIVGSPPCQGFSVIGKRDSLDARNELFAEFFRLVSEVRPAFYLAENVPGIMHDMHRAVLERAISVVEREYDVMQPMDLAANDYGAPTTRRRMFFVGFRKGAALPPARQRFDPSPGAGTVRVRDALSGLPTRIDPRRQTEESGWLEVDFSRSAKGYAQRLRGRVPPGVGDHAALGRLRARGEVSGFLGTIHSAEVARRYDALGAGERDCISKSYRLDPDGFCPTLRAGTGPDRGRFQAVRPIHPTECRVITPREAARLQGFPDWFQFHHTKWHTFRQIGNSVSPILAEHVFSVIARALDGAGKA